MKNTGMVREIDKLGRIVIPVEMRRTMDLPVGSKAEIWVDGDTIMIRRYRIPYCPHCGDRDKAANMKACGDIYCSHCGREL